MRLFLTLGLIFVAPFAAIADDVPKRKLIECAPGKNFVKMSEAIGSLKADKIDTINTRPSFSLLPNDGGDLPKRVFVRGNDGSEADLNYSGDGEVTDFLSNFEQKPGAELCVEDPLRKGAPKTDDAYAFNMRFNMNYLNTSGVYGLEELKDGIKDGKTALKKIVGGPGSLFVPSLTHLYVEFEDPETIPRFQGCELARSEKKCRILDYEILGGAYLIAFDDLTDMNADQFLIDGGTHTVSPSMSPEKMAKLMAPKE